MTTRHFKNCIVAATFVAAMAAGLSHAQEAESDDGWQFALPIYLWGANIGGTTQSGAGIEVDFSDVVDNLEMAFMGAFEARRGKWSIMADLIYLDVEGDNSINASLPIGPGIGINTQAKLDLTGRIIQVAGGYTLVQGMSSTLDLVAGARYLDLDTTLALTPRVLGPATPIEQSGANSVWDAIVGVKGNIGLGKRWYLPYYLDVGTGQSEFTWQAAGGVGFRAAKWIDVALVYRHLEWRFDSGEMVEDINFSGPALGAIFRF